MYAEAVSKTMYADLFGIIGLLSALLVFVLATIWAIRLSRKDIDRFSRLPLADDADTTIDPRSSR